MEGVADVDVPLLHALLREKETMPLPLLFAWITCPGPPPSDREGLSSGSWKCLPEAEHWAARLNATTSHSFVVSFLNFVRAESQFAVAAQAESKVCISTAETEGTRAGGVACDRDFGAPMPLMQNVVDQEPSLNSKFHSGAAVVNKVIVNRHEATRLNSGSKGILVKKKSELLIVSRNNEQAYDESFPALGASANRKTKKSGEVQTKPTRRVNPTPMTIPIVDSAFVLAKVDHGKPFPGHDKSKTRMLSSGPVKVDMDALMQRFERSRKQKQKPVHERGGQESSCSTFAESSVRQNPSTEELLSASSAAFDSSSKRKSEDDGETHKTAVWTDASERGILATLSVSSSFDLQETPDATVRAPMLSSGKCKRVATVHAKLLTAKLVPSLLGELRFLFQLLNMEDDLCDTQGGTGGISKSAHLMVIGDYGRECEDDKRLFIRKDDCSLYACAVMEQAERILNSVGEHLLSALIEHPAITRHAPTLLFRMKGLLACHQATALYSFKAYRFARRRSSASQQSDVVALEGSKRRDVPGMPICLPFEAARDSRNNYKTRESQKIYNNRELCRDHFYAIVREAASVHNAFSLATSAFEGDVHTRLQDSIRNLMKMLLAENYPWFTELFLEQIMQVAAYGETDPMLTDLARQDPAKLQRLHDRLTEGTRSRPSSFAPKQGGSGDRANEMHLLLSPGSPWSKVKNTANASRSKSSNFTIPNLNNDQQVGAQLDLLSLSPQFLRAYIWFLEAADSYRLNTQLVWSLKSKISRLSELSPHSRDAADIGSALTHRVLNLKALAGLLGFLFFSPGVGALSPTPCLSTEHPSEAEWDAQRSDPPVNVLEAIQKAKLQRSMLLTLPWVLDFLRWIKADQQALGLAYFGTLFSSVRDVYMYCLLDPQSAHFGVTSICILAQLDSFFEYMDLPVWDTASWSDRSGSSKICEDTTNRAAAPDDSASMGCELDIMIGVVDTRYIQHCCPILMGLRSLLVEAQRRQKQPNKSFSPGPVQRKSVRKITPVQHPKPSQVPTVGKPLFMIEDAPTSEKDHMKVKLQQTFFEQRPQLQRLVDFIVDTAAVNAAHAASLKCIPSVLKEAVKKLNIAFTDRLKDTVPGIDENERMGQIEAAIEHIITTSIQQALVPAMEYSRKHAADRTSEALAAMAAPNETSTILGTAAGIAAEAAGVAACKKTLASISSELRKCITQEVESLRKNSHYVSQSSSLCGSVDKEIKKERGVFVVDNENLKSEVGEPLECTTAYAYISDEMDGKENLDTMCNMSSEASKELSVKGGLAQSIVTNVDTLESHFKTSIVKRQLSFSDCKAQVAGDNSRLLSSTQLGQQKGRKVPLIHRVGQCCAVVQECCASGVLNDNQRNLLRLHVAAVSSSLEGILLQVDKGLPARGFDAVVFQSFSALSTNSLDFNNIELHSVACLDDDAMIAHLSTERGLARRSIALGLRFCLLCPVEAFGYCSDAVAKCFCAPLTSLGLTEKLASLTPLKFSRGLWHSGNDSSNQEIFGCPLRQDMGKESEKHQRVSKEHELWGCEREMPCPVRTHIGGPMQALLSMWIALVKVGLVEPNFLLAEFLTPWRWIQALSCEPWNFFSSWRHAVVHGVVNLLLKLFNEALISQEAEKVVCQFLKEMSNLQETDGDLNRMVEHVNDVHAWRAEVKNLSAWISVELAEEQLLVEKNPDELQLQERHACLDLRASELPERPSKVESQS